MTENLIKAVRSFAHIPDDQEKKLDSITKPVYLKKNNSFIREGEVPGKFGFVNKGLCRYFYSDASGKEFTKGFFTENTFVSSYTAMIQNRISYFGIEALEDTELLVINYQHWKMLLEGHSCWSHFLIGMLEKGYAVKEARERELLLFDAETRYKLFEKQFPGLDKRIRMQMIASYLGITPIALSRIRKKMGLINIG